jgi:DNA-binding transcriptional MerR regulator
MAEAPRANSGARRIAKSAAAFRTISEVSADLDLPQHVLRFWETKFPLVKPLKRGGGRRYYRPEDVDLLRRIRDLLYSDGYTIKGVQKLLREGGTKSVLDPGGARPAAKAAGSAPDGEGARVLEAGERAELESILEELTELRELLGGSGGE